MWKLHATVCLLHWFSRQFKFRPFSFFTCWNIGVLGFFSLCLIGKPAYTPSEQRQSAGRRATNATHLISLQISSSRVINCIFKRTKCKYTTDTLPINFQSRSSWRFLLNREGNQKFLEGFTKALIVSLCSRQHVVKNAFRPDKVFLLRVINSLSIHQQKTTGWVGVGGGASSLRVLWSCKTNFFSYGRNVDKEKIT